MLTDKGRLTERQLAERWQLSRRTLQRWRNRARNPLPHLVVGRSVWYFEADVDAWLEKQHNLGGIKQ